MCERLGNLRAREIFPYIYLWVLTERGNSLKFYYHSIVSRSQWLLFLLQRCHSILSVSVDVRPRDVCPMHTAIHI